MSIAAQRQFEMGSFISQALSRMEFSLNYQPQVDNFGNVVGVESLLRWNSPMLGNVSPAEFIPLAEENGTILPIGEWGIRAACVQMKRWHDNKLCDDSCCIAINVSPCQLQSLDIVEKITTIVREVGIFPHQVEIEITEGVLIGDVEDIKQKLSELKGLGFRTSADDFGTGYSSLSYIHHFPIDTLKIDRSFVQDIEHNRNDEAICSAVIGLARNLGVRAVAEGVETISQAQLLQSHGCEVYQGYYFGKPMSAVNMTSFFQRKAFLKDMVLMGDLPLIA